MIIFKGKKKNQYPERLLNNSHDNNCEGVADNSGNSKKVYVAEIIRNQSEREVKGKRSPVNAVFAQEFQTPSNSKPPLQISEKGKDLIRGALSWMIQVAAGFVALSSVEETRV